MSISSTLDPLAYTIQERLYVHMMTYQYIQATAFNISDHTKIAIQHNCKLHQEKTQNNRKQSQKMKCSELSARGHTKDIFTVNTKVQEHFETILLLSEEKNRQLSGPQTLSASMSVLLKKLPALCFWFTVSHLAFYQLYRSMESNSSNFFHSSCAV